MPLYEYRCKDCGHVFEHSKRMAEHASAHPSCPKCRSRQVESMPATVFVKTARKS